jgi:hypothetical protein
MGATAACRGGSLSFSGVDTIAMAACTFTNSSVPEWSGSPDAGGQCLTTLDLGYTAGAAMFAEKFRNATFTSSRSVSTLGAYQRLFTSQAHHGAHLWDLVLGAVRGL